MEGINELIVNTTKKEELIDITALVQNIIHDKEVKSGICYIFVPHTTCGLTINEHADSAVARDITETLKQIVPYNLDYKHIEGNSPAHLKSSLVGSSQTVLIEDGRACLGTWQGIFLCEFDGPRRRTVWVKVN
ncbi:secondary thiamine-phosphate synthase enzyme YjbQ [Bacillota bacterium LX-D]|nr:secondary thiamine-phosphate synthase enzyme YjbQ [Bacillota bacterium LX-D]